MFAQFNSSVAASDLHDRVRYTDNINAGIESPYTRPLSFQSPLVQNSAAISRSEYSASPAILDYHQSQQQHPLSMDTMDNFYSGSPLPGQDYSQGIDVQEMSMASFEVGNPSSGNVDKEYYPTMLSPPETPAMHPLRHSTPTIAGSSSYQSTVLQNQQQWNLGRADSMTWNPEQQINEMNFQAQQHHRAMSLPHISMPQDYQMVQMNYTTSAPSTKSYSSRKSSVSSSSSDKTFSCSHPGCERTFSRIQNLRSHMRCHLVTTPHNCKTCGLGFRRTTDLQRHVRTMHVPNDQKPWACSKCPKRFGRSDALKRHMSSRSKDHGCPGGPDLELLRQIEDQKRRKSAKQALQTVVEGTVF